MKPSNLNIRFFVLIRNRTLTGLIFFAVTIFLFTGCSNEEVKNVVEKPEISIEPIDENKLMDRVLRIDIQEMDVELEYDPTNDLISGNSIIKFRMRSGQVKPLIHFDLADNGVINSIILNGEELNHNNSSDVKTVKFTETTQEGMEFLRDCSGIEINTLKINYTFEHTDNYKSFFSNVNDIRGEGNEMVFPTINCPSDLSKHRIAFSVKSDRPYSFMGSGKVKDKSNKKIQKWLLDSERDVASYTIMWMLIPTEDVVSEEKVIDGVKIRVMAYKNGASIESAFKKLKSWIPELRANIGEFPMKRGLNVFLTERGGGMEYFGATITSLYALKHEVFHMYYGCSVIAKTYRDSWWDESINMWYGYRDLNSVTPVDNNFSSNIVSGRTPVSVGFDRRAYNEGAKIIESIASEIGGKDSFVAFLKHVSANHTFAPFNTFELIKYVYDFSGIDFKERIVKWLYNGTRTYFSPQGLSVNNYHKVDMTPPEEIIKKYKR